jgi:hypothetical protein
MRITKVGPKQRGAVVSFVAIALAVIMGFAGIALDVGYLEYQQDNQQAATDAAAMGGAQEAATDNCNNASDAVSAAVADAALNGYSSTYVQATSPPSTGPYANNACAVAVTITKTKAVAFSKLFGMTGKESTQAVGVASVSSGSSGCIWLLDFNQADQTNFSNSNIQVPTCAIYINAFANFSNSTINAGYIGWANGTNNTSGASFTKATPAPMQPVSDPCPSFAGCEWLTNNGPTPSQSGCSGSINQSGGNVGSAGTVSCYSNFALSGVATVCGIIEVTGSQLHLQNSTLTSCSSGVTFAMASSVNDVNFSSATLTLAAPLTGNTAGVVFWRNSNQSNSVNYSTCTCKLTGLLYYPATQVNYSSNNGAYALMVFGEMNISTSSFSVGTPAPGYGSGTGATLAQ